MKEPKKKIILDDMAMWLFIVGMMIGFWTATVIFNCIVPLLKG